MKYLSQLAKEKISGKRCLLRVNLDVAHYSFRIKAAVPTIQRLLADNVKIVLVSHRGRPQGNQPQLSLKPEVESLFQLVGKTFEWLENIRFDEREQQNDPRLAQELAARADFFVNDDFAVSHHQGASFVAITDYLPAYAGLLLEKEITTLSNLMSVAEQPLVVILGGVKTDDKLTVVDYFQDRAEAILLGSAYIGQKLLPRANIFLPQDFALNEQGERLDIGPATQKQYGDIIKKAKTVVWVGPLGKFEEEKYRHGSEAVAQAIAASGAFAVVGGGDTTEMLSQLGLLKRFGFVSTGGGAMIEFLAGKKLPGIEALERNRLSL